MPGSERPDLAKAGPFPIRPLAPDGKSSPGRSRSSLGCLELPPPRALLHGVKPWGLGAVLPWALAPAAPPCPGQCWGKGQLAGGSEDGSCSHWEGQRGAWGQAGPQAVDLS